MDSQTASCQNLEPETPATVSMLCSVPGIRTLVNELGVTEVRRRLLHMSPAVVPIGLPFTPHSDVWEPWLFYSALFLAASGLTFSVIWGGLFTREQESDWTSAVLGYITPMLVAFLLLPGRSEVALMTLEIVALGDGSAVLGGKLLAGRTLPWNAQKTYAGLLCFVGAGSLGATYHYWGEATPSVSVMTAFLICSTAALCAGIAESLPIRSADNFRVGVTAAVVGATLSWLFV